MCRQQTRAAHAPSTHRRTSAPRTTNSDGGLGKRSDVRLSTAVGKEEGSLEWSSDTFMHPFPLSLPQVRRRGRRAAPSLTIFGKYSGCVDRGPFASSGKRKEDMLGGEVWRFFPSRSEALLALMGKMKESLQNWCSLRMQSGEGLDGKGK